MTDTAPPAPQTPVTPNGGGMPQWAWAIVAIGSALASGAGGASFGAEQGVYASEKNVERLEGEMKTLQGSVTELTIAVRVYHGDTKGP